MTRELAIVNVILVSIYVLQYELNYAMLVFMSSCWTYLKLIALALLLVCATLLVLTGDSSADDVFQLREVSVDFKNFFPCGTDPLLTSNGIPNRTLGQGLNLTVSTSIHELDASYPFPFPRQDALELKLFLIPTQIGVRMSAGMKKFKNMGHTMGRYRCVTLDDEGYEKCLAGSRGEIWETGSGDYKCFIVLPSRDEKIYRFKAEDLTKWVLKLKVPANPDEQAVWANNPNSRTGK